MVGVMGLGKRYSVGFTRCDNCNQTTVIALWQPSCRTCKAESRDAIEAFHGGWVNEMFHAFARVPRPIGRR